MQNPGSSAVRVVPTTRALSPALGEAVPLNPPIAERHETAKDGTVWTVIQSGENRGRRQRQNVMTAAPSPTAHAKRNIEDALTAFLCLVDDAPWLRHTESWRTAHGK